MTQTRKVLVVDDEQNIVSVIKAYLEAEGHEVFEAYDGEMALEIFEQVQPEIVILDLMMPMLSGEDVCKEIRKTSEVPIIMLTAKVAEREKIAGLDLGADDYVSKPFSPGELMARIRAISRRLPEENTHEEIYFNDGYLKIDDEMHQVFIEDTPISVTVTEYDILKLISVHEGRIFSREELINRVLGYDYDGYDRTIDAHIKNLRKKLSKPYIETVYGLGYRFKGAANHEKD